MYVVDIQQIIDYAKCPMYYKFKYINKDLKTEYINTIEKYDEDIHKVIYYSFTRVQESQPIRIEDIKAAWGRAWIKDRRKSGILFTDTLSNKDTYNERRKKGIENLLHFQKVFSKDESFPIIINKKYEIQLSKNIILTGSFEVVRECTDSIGDKFIECCVFKTDEHTNNKVCKEFDLKLSASSIALKEIMKNENIKYMIYHVDKKSKSYIDKNTMSLNVFKKTIINVYKAIHNNIFYMSPDERCHYCIYKELCSNVEKVSTTLD